MKKGIFYSSSSSKIQQGGGGGGGGGADGLDLTCDRRAATVNGDDDGGRRLSFWSEVGDRGAGTATEVQEKIPFLVQEKICSSLRFDRD